MKYFSSLSATLSKSHTLDLDRERHIFSPPSHALPHPDLCFATLRMLIQFEHNNNNNSNNNLLTHLLLKLIAICKNSEVNRALLYEQGAVQILLDFVAQKLSVSDKLETEQTEPEVSVKKPDISLVLDLTLVLLRHRLTSRELRAILRLFQLERAPVDDLLDLLLTLADDARTSPRHSVEFPVLTSLRSSDLELSVRSLDSDTLTVSMRVTNGTLSKPGDSLMNSKVQPSQRQTLEASRSTGVTVVPRKSTATSCRRLPYAFRSAPVHYAPLPNEFWTRASGKSFSATLWLRHDAMQGLKNEGKTARKLFRKRHNMPRSGWSTFTTNSCKTAFCLQ